MMKYNNIIELATLLTNNDVIKKGLTITYELDKVSHRSLEEEIYLRLNDNKPGELKHKKVFDVGLGEINFRFIEK